MTKKLTCVVALALLCAAASGVQGEAFSVVSMCF